MTLLVRLAAEDDLPAIVAIYNQAVAAEQTADLEPTGVEARRDWLASHGSDRRPVLVCEEDGVVVGWASLSDHRPGLAAVRRTAEISYYVDESRRRRGIASALLADAIERCPSLGIRALFGILMADNAGSIAFLERHGFSCWGRLPRAADFHGRIVDQVYYGRSV